jgi:hypothetical protein
MSLFVDAIIGFSISLVMQTITENGHILSFLNKFDKYEIISKPLWLCNICSSFWYTFLVVSINQTNYFSIPIAMSISILVNKYYDKQD